MSELLTPSVQAAIAALARRFGVEARDARPLRTHDATTVLLQHEHLVIRLVPTSEETKKRANRAVSLASWLVGQDFPSVRPAAPAPIVLPGRIATVWHEVPPHPAGSSLVMNAALGRLVRELHTLPPPPFTMPGVDPLARLRAALQLDAGRPVPVLMPADSRFLEDRAGELANRYAAMQFPLGVGLIHNDAHAGNLVPDPASRHGYLLTDWEGAARGPRELDVVLVGAPGSRFGDSADERAAFVAGYGYDIATWPQHQALRDIRDLHALAAYIRVAPDKPAALAQLRVRIDSIRTNDHTVRWAAV
jgi:aminoglycoside phosphotransferase (APT) family kinase protein